MSPLTDEAPYFVGDPTQRLLAALGRFALHVGRAEDGAPQSEWCDAALVELAVGIELACDQRWAEIAFALTDTARVLQAYADAGRANERIGYLIAAYEHLCQMIGVLIVGSAMDNAFRKWQPLNEQALAELAAAGLSLPAEDNPNNPWPSPEVEASVLVESRWGIWAALAAYFRRR